uniref:Uncharacterized protein n=1 Tax=Wolbachia endosymbiont of Aleurodicus floccissimus TaxID=2152762 RepID=A0A3B0JM80_9RICK
MMFVIISQNFVSTACNDKTEKKEAWVIGSLIAQ